MSKKLAGKVAVVTGASKGIGAGIAKHLATEGAAVVVNYSSSKEGADRVVSEIKSAGGKAIAVQANLAKEAAVRRLFAETKKTFDKLDILVNNAGVYEFAALESITLEHYHKQFDLNVLGLLLATQEAAKLMGKSGGSVINNSSVAATSAPPQTAVYSGTKAAVVAITRRLAKELGPRKIRVNAINPGMVDTEGSAPPASTKAISASKRNRKPHWAASACPTISPRPPCFWRPTIQAGSPARRSTSPEGCDDSRSLLN